jgi:uncharacterized protein YegL
MDFDTFATPNQFAFSAVEMSNLGATEYTLVNMLVDESGSVGGFQTELQDAMKIVFESCKKHPRSQNLLLRTAAFEGRDVREIHGFTTLDTLDPKIFQIRPSGSTPLYDATLDSVETTAGYAKILNDQDYFCNGIVFVMTDGEENSSTRASVSKIRDAVEKIRKDESLESIKLILIGVNDTTAHLKSYLDSFKTDAGFDDYISLGDVTPGKLAKLADWISQSISSTSQSLGTGGPSKAVNFVI